MYSLLCNWADVRKDFYAMFTSDMWESLRYLFRGNLPFFRFFRRTFASAMYFAVK